MGEESKKSFRKLQALTKNHMGNKLLVFLCLWLALTAFIHFREVRVEILEIDTVAKDYVVAKIDFAFPDEEESLKFLTPSISGGIFTIKYTLRVFVKHDSWNEFGEGKFFNLPIKII